MNLTQQNIQKIWEAVQAVSLVERGLREHLLENNSDSGSTGELMADEVREFQGTLNVAVETAYQALKSIDEGAS